LIELPPLVHRFYAVPSKELIICVGEAQPSIPEEAFKLASKVIGVAEEFNVTRIYTMAAYPVDYQEVPKVYGIFSDEKLREELGINGLEFINGEGAVSGLNGVLIGIAKERGIEGVCLLCEIRYANVPQHLSSKAVLDKLTTIIGLEVDTSQLKRRAKKMDATIRKSLDDFREYGDYIDKEKREFRYIS
jgi:proteasome assembly chaperone (PAC2) family protein